MEFGLRKKNEDRKSEGNNTEDTKFDYKKDFKLDLRMRVVCFNRSLCTPVLYRKQNVHVYIKKR